MLIYHLVFPTKYRRVVFDDYVDNVVKNICLEIEKRYEIKFLEIGTDDVNKLSYSIVAAF